MLFGPAVADLGESDAERAHGVQNVGVLGMVVPIARVRSQTRSILRIPEFLAEAVDGFALFEREAAVSPSDERELAVHIVAALVVGAFVRWIGVGSGAGVLVGTCSSCFEL